MGGGNITIILLQVKVRTLIMALILMSVCSALFGYDIYVDSSADPFVSDGTPLNPFSEIQDAVVEIEDKHGSYTIHVAPGIYDPIVISEPQFETLRILSTIPHHATIDGGNTAPCVKINLAKEVILDGLLIQNGNAFSESIDAIRHIYINTTPPPPSGVPHHLLGVETTFTSPGGGIQVVDSEKVKIINCHISGNKAHHGAGIFALCTSTTNLGHPHYGPPSYLEIVDSRIFDNHALGVMARGGALALHSVNTDIRSSEVYENNIGDGSTYDQWGWPEEIIRMDSFCEDNNFYVNIEEAIIDKNVARKNIINSYAVGEQFNVSKSNIVGNATYNGNTVYLSTISLGYLRRQVSIINSVITNNSCQVTPDMNNYQVKSGGPTSSISKIDIHMKNNCILNADGLSIGDYSNQSILQDNIDVSPLFSDVDSRVYTLLWDQNQRSPLINAGCPEIDGVIQTDPDGTPPDIGAVYYPHHHMEYFPINAQQNPSGIYWLSFPVVDDRTYENGIYWNELGYMFDANMQGPPAFPSQLELIDWSYNGEDGILQNLDNDWHDSEHRVTQAMGFKIKFAPGAPVDPVIVNGFRADPLNTPIKWVVSVEENGQMQPFANRIGYFMPYTIRAGDALSAYLPGSTRYRYLDYVHTIKTQTWSTYRVSEELGSPWVIDPNSYTFSEGDMVELLLIPEAPEEMYWSGFSTPPVPPVVRPQTEAFEYEEKLDYSTIFISFDPEDMPDELGLFVDGECRGAAVVDSSLIDVCLYPGSATGDSELEIVFHYASKGKKVAKGWQAYNHASMLFEERNLHPGDLGRFGYISFSEQAGESLVPLQTLLMQNYPNPFNPTTNISFVLAEQGSARMDVYNLRGQRVRTLFNTEFSKGRHTIEWDGRDDQERQLASGIYFYRLTTPQSMYSKKMILMK